MVNCLISFNTAPIRMAAHFLTAPFSLLCLVSPFVIFFFFFLVLFLSRSSSKFLLSIRLFHFLVPGLFEPSLLLRNLRSPLSPARSRRPISCRGRFYLAARRTHGRTIDEDEEGMFPLWPFHPRREGSMTARDAGEPHERKKSRA